MISLMHMTTIATMQKWQDLMCRWAGRVHRCSGFFCNKEGYNDSNSVNKKRRRVLRELVTKGM
jgi:hypothetical protein